METIKKKVIVHAIDWDTDGDNELFDSLPQNLVFDIEYPSNYDYVDISEMVSDKITEISGYCHNGAAYYFVD